MIINKKYKIIGSIVLAVIAIAVIFIKYSYGGKSELNKNNNSDIFIDDEIKDKSSTPSNNDNSCSNTLSENNSKFKEIVVEIKGEVKNPNIYKLNENDIIQDLIDKAGGLTEFADISKINRAEKLTDHVAIIIPNKNEANTQMTLGNSSSNTSNGNTLINLNTASETELQNLPGIGPSKSKSIIEYREKNGGFKSVDEIKNIKGIGESSFEKLKDKITI